MTIDTDDLINSILGSLDRIPHIDPKDIPQLDLYMDQLTTFIDSRLKTTARYQDGDKILTKTMINNYAKNDLLPPPNKKKYTNEHIMLLIFIYYLKGILSINDIQELLNPISEKYFGNNGSYGILEIYNEVFRFEKEQVAQTKEDILNKFANSQAAFEDAPEEDRDFLKKFAFIGYLGFDVYVKKLIIEKMIDDMVRQKAEEKARLEKAEKEAKEKEKEAKENKKGKEEK